MVPHCAAGQRITGPWALAVGARVEERYGLDGQVMAGDDGIVSRIPHGERPPGADLFVFTPEEIEEEVRRLVGSSALFAARFRECAARALLSPRRDPNQRAPLWQQRQRAAHLLEVARPHPDFPIMLEAARECLQDVYDLPALVELMGQVRRRRLQVREVETPSPPPSRARCCSATWRSSSTTPMRRWPNAAPPPWRWTSRCWPSRWAR
ncbi:hypothetical protein [Brachybacterium sp. GPGPB12]|uniref:hypothetical protein n=1 Tax=Brachybacterium sp. GPGPB12 TaxID=3023517 RepID=UPI0031342FAB